MKIKVSELTTRELDIVVAYLLKLSIDEDGYIPDDEVEYQIIYWSPTSDWSQAGPIIEQEKLHIEPWNNNRGWLAFSFDRYSSEHHTCKEGSTPLIAAMRCYVENKLGCKVNMKKIYRSLEIEPEIKNESSGN